jgi:hypothetical protein
MSPRRAPGPLAVAAALRRRAVAAARGAHVAVRVYDAAGQATTLDPHGVQGSALLAAADELIRRTGAQAE